MEIIINDWAGNRVFKDKVFTDVYQAWDFLIDQFPDDDDLQEYSVLEI